MTQCGDNVSCSSQDYSNTICVQSPNDSEALDKSKDVEPNYRQIQDNDTMINDDRDLLSDHCMECPTCRGSGTIRSGDSSLVALIPIKDKRLKPKRTKLKIFFAILITFVISGITVFFLYPRDPSLELLSAVKYNIFFPKAQPAHILLKNQYRVKNDNFMSITLAKPVMGVTWENLQVGEPLKTATFPNMTISARSSKTFSIYVRTSYDDQYTSEFLRQWCSSMSFSELVFSFSFQLTASSFYRDEKLTSDDSKVVSCFYNSSILNS